MALRAVREKVGRDQLVKWNLLAPNAGCKQVRGGVCTSAHERTLRSGRLGTPCCDSSTFKSAKRTPHGRRQRPSLPCLRQPEAVNTSKSISDGLLRNSHSRQLKGKILHPQRGYVFKPRVALAQHRLPRGTRAGISTPIGVVSVRLGHAGMDATPSALDKSRHDPRVGALRCANPGLKYVTPLE
jgi:hypothetical protein